MVDAASHPALDAYYSTNVLICQDELDVRSCPAGAAGPPLRFEKLEGGYTRERVGRERDATAGVALPEKSGVVIIDP